MTKREENAILKTMTAVAIVLFTTVTLILLFVRWARIVREEAAIIENCHKGIIVNKVISSSKYKITFQGEYEYDGETKIAERTITVSENVYLSYSVGDEFDEQNLIVSVSDVSASDADDDDDGVWDYFWLVVWPPLVIMFFALLNKN